MTKFRNWCGTLALLALLIAPMQAPAADTTTEVRSAIAAQRALPRAPQLPRSAFLDGRGLAAVRLSPAGDYVAYLREQGESRSLFLLPTAGGRSRVLVASTQAEQLFWSRDGRWLFLRAAKSLASVSVDGRVVYPGGPAVAFVGNVAEYGTGFPILTRARPDDGLLDACVLPVRSPVDLMKFAMLSTTGDHVREEGVVYAKGKRVRIEAINGSGPVPVQVDGDPAGHTPVEIDLLPARLGFIVPDE